jgi:hypothetical protein
MYEVGTSADGVTGDPGLDGLFLITDPKERLLDVDIACKDCTHVLCDIRAVPMM